MNPQARLHFIEEGIRTWNFRQLLDWVHQHQERWSIREELFICYVRERLGDHTSWHSSMTRLRQRVFADVIEHLAFRALNLRSVKDLRLVAADLKAMQWMSSDLLFQVAWVRVADRMAMLQQLDEAWQLYQLFSKDEPRGEWQNLTNLKAITIAYLSSQLDNEALSQVLRSHMSTMTGASLARTYYIAFHLYISSISARRFDQVRLQHQLRKALSDHTLHKDHPHLSAAANYLLNPEQGLGAALWRSQMPDQSQSTEADLESNPEMLWFTHCIEGLGIIQSASDQQSISTLQLALKQHEKQGNGLLAACARSRLLGILLKQNHLRRNAELAEFWQQELSLLQVMPYTELQSFGAMLQAAHRYRQGNFQDCLNDLRRAKRLSQDPVRRNIISIWLAHARGRAHRNLDVEMNRVSLQLLNYFFSPSLKSLGNSNYLVSEIYPVDLTLYPVLNRLLQQILRHPYKALATHSVQDLVWRQTSSTEGWKQKLRNTIARLRSKFRFMLAPLVIQAQGSIHLNLDALSFDSAPARLQSERIQEILKALQKGPRSIDQLCQATGIPSSTLRRYVKELTTQGLVSAEVSRTRTLYGLSHPP